MTMTNGAALALAGLPLQGRRVSSGSSLMHNRRLIYFCLPPFALFSFPFDFSQSVFVNLFTPSICVCVPPLIPSSRGGMSSSETCAAEPRQFKLNAALSCAANLERNPSWSPSGAAPISHQTNGSSNLKESTRLRRP